jgi:hypothetical protein
MITRDMLAQNRKDQLEDVNLFIRRNKLDSMYKSLSKALMEAVNHLSDYEILFTSTGLTEEDGAELKRAFDAGDFGKVIEDQNNVGRVVVAVQLPSALGIYF